MSIRARVLLFQGIVVLALTALAITGLLFLHRMDHIRERVRLATQQLDAMMQIAVSAHRYSEQIAEMLVLGQAAKPELLGARSQVIEAFTNLEDLIDAEASLAIEPEESEAQRRELRHLSRMRALFTEVDGSVERLLALEQEGARTEAIALLRSEIEGRLDSELDRLIAEAVVVERVELARAEADGEAFAFRLRLAIVTISIGVVVLTLVIGSGIMIPLMRPIAELTAGARAIAEGKLDHRIGYAGRNEVGVLAHSFNDMAARLRRHNAELVAGQADLERQVERRTEELEQANRQLSLVDRQRVRFLADASHELRTPLTVLRGEAEVALRAKRDPPVAYRHALERIVEQAAGMSRLVDDLLFLARSEAGEIRFDLRPVGLRSVVSSALREAATLARQDQLVLDDQAPGEGPTVQADPSRLKQAMLILIDNAAKYATPGAPIRVALQVVDGVAAVSVTDRGPGIPPKELARVFDRFYRGENARAAGISGSGLGLAIARWIMERHGGDIVLSSTPGGTTAEMRMPSLG